MTLLECIILAIVEGLTEFLPVSSTGHMILTEGLLRMESTPYLRAFTVFIQLGAILSVLVLYPKRFFVAEPRAGQTSTRWHLPWRFYLTLLIGCLPAGIMGILLERQFDRLLGSVPVVATMLLLGGIFMLFIDRIFARADKKQIGFRNAFVIGCFQCLAMIPGLSRSMVTIVGGLQQGISRRQAAEFSFFLAVPIMLGATILKGYKLYEEFGWAIYRENATTLIVGNVVAFLISLLAIRFFIDFVSRHGFKIFGYYRIVIGALMLILLLAGVPLSMQ